MIIIIASEDQGKLACIASERRNFKRSSAYIYFLFFSKIKRPHLMIQPYLFKVI